ncbi:MAG: Lrp/AsnC family transcriptional regulator [Chloroherpetonaceae bacterium]|nr:Lrp/AsnC family transcriptional regulator [Chthonomonadaceae bacterium]MDW8206863.1 Lrp/AsnC family transcriptional regulator [Chloroherpetonaceae bacterium]
MRQILTILEQNALATPAQIAAQTGIDVETVTRQIAQWEREGVIRRYKTVIDWERLGEEQVWAYIDVKVTPERGVGFDDVAERIYRYPEVRSVYLVSGAQDLRCVVVGKSLREIADFVAQKLATIDRVTATATHFLLKRYKDDGEIFAETEEDHRLMVTP